MEWDMMIAVAANRVSDVANGLYTGAVQVVVVLAGLNEQLVLNVALHLIPWPHKVILTTVYLLLGRRPRRICHTNASNVRSYVGYIESAEQSRTAEQNKIDG